MATPKRSNQERTESPRPLLEKQWVREVREKDDRQAFENIFRVYYSRLYHFSYGYVGTESAEDTIQTVFLKIWANRKSWDPPGTVKQYLFAAVKNEALNILRNRKMKTDSEDKITRILKEQNKQKPVHENLEVEELQESIHQGIDQLPPRCRQIFLLSRRSGLTYSEIADTLDISIHTVNTQMGRALKYLKKHLVDYISFIIAINLTSLL